MARKGTSLGAGHDGRVRDVRAGLLRGQPAELLVYAALSYKYMRGGGQWESEGVRDVCASVTYVQENPQSFGPRMPAVHSYEYLLAQVKKKMP